MLLKNDLNVQSCTINNIKKEMCVLQIKNSLFLKVKLITKPKKKEERIQREERDRKEVFCLFNFSISEICWLPETFGAEQRSFYSNESVNCNEKTA